MKLIFEWADRDTTNTIWKYLLILSAYLSPSANVKKVLKETLETIPENEDSESKFLEGIMKKLENKIDVKSSDPLELMNQVFSSGVLPDVIKELQEGMAKGDLDINKLMGEVSGMMGNLTSGDSGFDPMSMITGMMGQMNLPK